MAEPNPDYGCVVCIKAGKTECIHTRPIHPCQLSKDGKCAFIQNGLFHCLYDCEPAKYFRNDIDNLQSIIKEQVIYRVPKFKLSSGNLSSYFINLDAVFANGKILKSVCLYLVNIVTSLGLKKKIDGFAGPGLGAYPLVIALASMTETDWLIDVSPKEDHFLNRRGSVDISGRNFVLVDDVVTTGNSIKRVGSKIWKKGGNILAVVSVVDRGDIARTVFTNLATPYVPLFNYYDFNIPSIIKEKNQDG